MTPTNRTKGFIPVGGVAKPHGIRGELCIKSHADSPSLFGHVAALFLQHGERAPEPFTVRSWRVHQDFVLVKLQGVDDRNRADELRGRTVLVREDDLPELGDDEHYLHEMMGCRVALEDGTEIGVLEQFFETAEQDTWVIINEAGTEILLPAVPEFVLDVDLDAEIITVAPPEGLLDLYLNAEPPKKKKRKHPNRGRRKAKGSSSTQQAKS